MSEDYRFWELPQALAWYRDHMDAASACGWALSLCGSVLCQGFGRDLDVLAIPIASNAVDIDQYVSWWDGDLNVLKADDKPTGVKLRVYEEEGHLLDVVFFPHRTKE